MSIVPVSYFVGLTASEMLYEARIIYESIASANAPGFNEREWSVLLTQAQEKVTRKILDEGLDKNEFNRRAIGSLIKHIDVSSFDIGPVSYPNSYVPRLAFSNEYKILAIIGDFIDTNTKKQIKVKPITYEYYWVNIENPFRKPSSWNDGYYWKLEMNSDKDNTITPSPLIITDGLVPTVYRFDIVQRPSPIIISTLTAATSIEGETTQMNCQMDHSIHREIVKEAATLAYAYLQEQVGYQIQKNEENS